MRTNLFLPTILLTALASQALIVTIPCLLAAGLATTASAATLAASREFTNSIGMKFVQVRPGQFVMGCGVEPPTNEAEWKARDWDESPAHKVKTATSYYLSAYEVTNAQYEQFDPEHKKLRGMFGVSKADNEPVTMVTWQVRKTPFGGINVGQKAAALRLASGALLLCATDARKPPLTGRRGVCAALSDDGGRTWAHCRALDGVRGYLSVAQAPDGIMYVFGSRMSCAAFNEVWLKEGKPIDQRVNE